VKTQPKVPNSALMMCSSTMEKIKMRTRNKSSRGGQTLKKETAQKLCRPVSLLARQDPRSAHAPQATNEGFLGLSPPYDNVDLFYLNIY
jgi:hypothetical protein